MSKLDFRNVLIITSATKCRRGMALALIQSLEQPKFSALDPFKQTLPDHQHDWSETDLVIIDASIEKTAIRSWFFDYPDKEVLPPVIFIDSHATVDDAGDFVRAGAADYIDLGKLKRRRLTRSLVIAASLSKERTMASPDGQYSSQQAKDIAGVLNMADQNDEQPSSSDLGKVVVLDDPGETGLLPIVNVAALSASTEKEEPVSQPDNRTWPGRRSTRDMATQLLPQVDEVVEESSLDYTVDSLVSNDNAIDANEVPLAAMDEQTERETTSSRVIQNTDAILSPSAGQVFRQTSQESTEDPMLATGLMSILERNDIQQSEEKTAERSESNPMLLGQRWPFTHSDIQKGKASLGDYDILEFIGVGGTASVFKVKRKTDNTEFAMKLFDTDSSDRQGKERFLRGYKLLSTIHHQNIIRIEELIENGENACIISEYLPNGDLKSRIDSGIDRQTAVRYAAQIASALQSAHENRVIHRDLKPANILFRPDDSLVLVDFGIARQTGEIGDQVTMQGQVMGTPYYISPEQATGGEMDHRSDLYALGVIMYEMLEGKRPYEGASSIEIMNAHVRGSIPYLGDKEDMLNGVVSRLLSKKPEERFPSGRDVVNALRSICPNVVPLEYLVI